MEALLGKKIGMTQVFDEKGKVVPVTVLKVGPCYILRIIKEEKNNYYALQLGFEERKIKNLTRPELKFFEKIGVKPQRYIREVRINVEEINNYRVGDSLDLDIFAGAGYVDVQGNSLGKGFQGGMKRWGWKGGPKTHGSMSHRRPGSIGSSTTPGRVLKGRHMPGRMGNEKVTVKNLKIISRDKEKNILLVKGAVPGAENNLLIVKKSKKQPQVKQ
ncbi:MAG: 50S ribosomal protein L3 [Candidatus Omnitrophica bacterium]|nr:50S ribosomal protein L3 [Candidatus Omnitrophota bacterium]MCM8798143.1 50S ribosomal protein L3 [Candidatus Omnitrophota bacterium]